MKSTYEKGIEIYRNVIEDLKDAALFKVNNVGNPRDLRLERRLESDLIKHFGGDNCIKSK